MVVEKMRNLLGCHSGKRQRRYTVLGKKRNRIRLTTCFRGSSNGFAQEEKFVDVIRHGGMPMPLVIAIVDRRQFPSDDIVTGFLLDLTDGGQAGTIPDIRPPSGESPGAVADFSNQQYSLIRKYRGAYVNFRRGIPYVEREQLKQFA